VQLRAGMVANDKTGDGGPVWRPRRCILLPFIAGSYTPPADAGGSTPQEAPLTTRQHTSHTACWQLLHMSYPAPCRWPNPGRSHAVPGSAKVTVTTPAYATLDSCIPGQHPYP
jgi:hypothetical protein